MGRSRTRAAAVVCALLLLLLNGCSGRGPASAPVGSTGSAPAPPGGTEVAPLQALIDGARQEGQLSLVWGEGTLGGSEGVARLVEGFNRTYGLTLDVRFTPGPSMPNMAAKIAEEYQAARTATTDVVVGYAIQMATMLQADALEPVEWTRWAPNIQDPQLTAAGGRAVTFQSSVQGLTYNSSKLVGDAVPRTMEDVLKPQYRGLVASTPYASGFNHLASPDLWGRERTLGYATRLADQLAGLIRCNETVRIVSGEFDILAMDCSQGNALAAKAKGAPIDFLVPSDAPIMVPLYLAVPRKSAHPHAAKLWIDYILSREAQDLLYQYDQQDSHLVVGSKTAQDLEATRAAGVKLQLVDVDFYQRQNEKELAQSLAEIERILARR
jgi:ABC-type Fe3+ transport system substrate-binding protein